MLQNSYFLAKIGADTAKHELIFSEILSLSSSRAGFCSHKKTVRTRGPMTVQTSAEAIFDMKKWMSFSVLDLHENAKWENGHGEKRATKTRL